MRHFKDRRHWLWWWLLCTGGGMGLYNESFYDPVCHWAWLLVRVSIFPEPEIPAASHGILFPPSDHDCHRQPPFQSNLGKQMVPISKWLKGFLETVRSKTHFRVCFIVSINSMLERQFRGILRSPKWEPSGVRRVEAQKGKVKDLGNFRFRHPRNGPFYTCDRTNGFCFSEPQFS